MSRPFISIDIEIRSQDVPDEVTEAVKRTLQLILNQQKILIPNLSHDIQVIKE